MTDYRKFLGAKDVELVLPYLGGDRLDAPDRRLRLHSRCEPGWWRFSVSGRVATPKERVDAPELTALPKVRGYLLGERLVGERGRTERVHLLPADEPPRFAPIVARRWHGGALIFESLEFESEIEERVRRALEDGHNLADLKGVPAPLRAAFALALAEQAGRRIGIPAHAAELRAHTGTIADRGAPEAERVLRQLDAERRAYLERLAAMPHLASRVPHVPVIVPRPRFYPNAEERAEAALESAGARLRRLRALQGNMLEVTYDLEGESFVTLVDANTLQVIDAGICLAGADREVTLESLPSVIREAMETGRLVVTRHFD